MSFVTPHASATSSIDVAAKPEPAKAAAAPCRIDACRSSRRSSRRAGTSTMRTPLPVYTEEYTVRPNRHQGDGHDDRPGQLHRRPSCCSTTPWQSRSSRAACAATVASTRTAVRVASHSLPRARHRGLAGAERRDLRHRDPARAARHLARAHPQRRPGPTPDLRRGPRAADRHAHPHRHRRGLRCQHPPAAARRHAAALRRGHPGHRHRPPGQGPVRGPRPRRGRLRGGGGPPRHVVRRPRHRLRVPDREGRHRRHARPHGLRPGARAQEPTSPARSPTTSTRTSSSSPT